MAPKKRYAGKIPFDSKGNLLEWTRCSPDHPPTIDWIELPNGESQRVPAGEWRDNYEFDATMIIIDFVRGRSAARFALQDEEGREYEMFMSDALDMIQRTELIAYGHIEGRWTFCKKGANYGIQMI